MTNIVVFDVETTGKDRAVDQVIELCLQLGLGDGAECRGWRIKPSVPIHPDAQAVHGITAEALADAPPFSAVAAEIASYLNAADVIVGYNVAFDLDMVAAELARAGMPPLELAGKQVVDVLRLWQHVEPRTLAAAHAKFCGSEMADAHQAAADVAATARVLTGMIASWGLQPGAEHRPEQWAWAELAAMADPFPGRERWIGPSFHVQWNDAGDAVFAFGKHKGCRIDSVDPGFPHYDISHTKRAIAVRHGAIECDRRTIVEHLRRLRPVFGVHGPGNPAPQGVPR